MLTPVTVLLGDVFTPIYAVRGSPGELSTVHDGEVWAGRVTRHVEEYTLSGVVYPAKDVLDQTYFFASEEEAKKYYWHTTYDARYHQYNVLLLRAAQPPSKTPLTGGWIITVSSKVAEVFVPCHNRMEAQKAYTCAVEKRSGLPEGSCYFTRGDYDELRFSTPFSRSCGGSVGASMTRVVT